MTTHEILHIIRNPLGKSEEEVRAARLAAADLIEDQAKDIETLSSVSKEMARTGMQIRNDLAEAKLKNIAQAKEIAALRTGDTCGRSCEGTAYRIELRQALAKVEWQAKQIEALRKALTEIAEWTDRYTSPGHPVSTVAKRALTGK